MTHSFETEKNKKALTYTILICGTLLILFFLIRWKSVSPAESIVQDLIEINLGNNTEGVGMEQPLIKGTPTVNKEPDISSGEKKSIQTKDPINPIENPDKDAAAVINTKQHSNVVEKTNNNNNNNRTAKITYNGPDKGKNGNDHTDNGYKYQGNNPNSKGDNGAPDGNKDSYGNTPGGKTGGPRVIKGNRRIVQHYKFEGDLNKATIYAIIKVSPNGEGRFTGFDKGSTDRTQTYANAISNYLKKIQFDKSDNESQVTVEFVFDVN
jgi:hypothetical protein